MSNLNHSANCSENTINISNFNKDNTLPLTDKGSSLLEIDIKNTKSQELNNEPQMATSSLNLTDPQKLCFLQQKCENPELILESVEEWNTRYQMLVDENKSMRAGLDLLLVERKKMQTEKTKFTEEIEKFHENIKNSHIQQARLNGLDEENEDLKLSICSLQDKIGEQHKEHKEIEINNMENLKTLEDLHNEEMKSLTTKLSSSAEYEKKLMQEQITKCEKEMVELQMKINQLQAAKESELTNLSMEYENKLAKLQRQKIQTQQNQINSSNQEIFRKKLQHMKDEYEQEIKTLKTTIENIQFGSRPSPRSHGRLTLTSVGGKKRKT